MAAPLRVVDALPGGLPCLLLFGDDTADDALTGDACCMTDLVMLLMRGVILGALLLTWAGTGVARLVSKVRGGSCMPCRSS